MYNKTAWQDQILDPVQQTIIQPGTKITAARLNNMEGGIEGAHTLVEQLAQLVGGSFVAAPSGAAGLAFTTSGLTANWTTGVAYVDGVRFSVAAGSIQLNATQGQYLYVDSDGAVKRTTTQATADAKCPLWYFATDASTAVTSTDRRKILQNLFQSGVDGKAIIATAINFKGGTVPGTAPYTHQQLADGVYSIQRGSGNALPADVLIGKTFSNDSGPGLTGTMPDNGNWNATPGPTAITIPAGKHGGGGKVAAVVVPAANVLTGTTIAGTAGTMPNRGAPTITPGTAAQTLQAGYYSGGTVQGDSDLVAANIRAGVNVFGVDGTLAPYRTASGTIARIATGNPSSDSGGLSDSYIEISGLGFKPKSIEIINDTNPTMKTLYNEESGVYIKINESNSSVTATLGGGNPASYVIDGGFRLYVRMATSTNLPSPNFRWYAQG